jgi:hypothetical protein
MVRPAIVHRVHVVGAAHRHGATGHGSAGDQGEDLLAPALLRKRTSTGRNSHMVSRVYTGYAREI